VVGESLKAQKWKAYCQRIDKLVSRKHDDVFGIQKLIFHHFVAAPPNKKQKISFVDENKEQIQSDFNIVLMQTPTHSSTQAYYDQFKLHIQDKKMVDQIKKGAAFMSFYVQHKLSPQYILKLLLKVESNIRRAMTQRYQKDLQKFKRFNVLAAVVSLVQHILFGDKKYIEKEMKKNHQSETTFQLKRRFIGMEGVAGYFQHSKQESSINMGLDMVSELFKTNTHPFYIFGGYPAINRLQLFILVTIHEMFHWLQFAEKYKDLESRREQAKHIHDSGIDNSHSPNFRKLLRHTTGLPNTRHETTSKIPITKLEKEDFQFRTFYFHPKPLWEEKDLMKDATISCYVPLFSHGFHVLDNLFYPIKVRVPSRSCDVIWYLRLFTIRDLIASEEKPISLEKTLPSLYIFLQTQKPSTQLDPLLENNPLPQLSSRRPLLVKSFTKKNLTQADRSKNFSHQETQQYILLQCFNISAVYFKKNLSAQIFFNYISNIPNTES
jgi:hypothetical protein